MPQHDYHFITHWRVAGTDEVVYEILEDATDLPRWWPEVYLEAEERAKGDAHGVGKHVRLLTKGWLPYTLSWSFICTAADKPRGFTLEAEGDFQGRGVWTFVQDGPYVDITFDWKVRAEKPLLRYLSFALRPAFAANHRWAMRKGEAGLRRELKRRDLGRKKAAQS